MPHTYKSHVGCGNYKSYIDESLQKSVKVVLKLVLTKEKNKKTFISDHFL